MTFRDSSLLASIFLTGMSTALFNPLQSSFFVRELGASPGFVGVYMALSIGCAMLTSHWIGSRSDDGRPRQRLIRVSALAGMLAFLAFATLRDKVWLALASLTLVSLTSIAAPQLFALAASRSSGNGAGMLGSMRAMVSLAWVIGPPLSFGIAAALGYQAAFALLIAIYGLIWLASHRLPASDKPQTAPAAAAIDDKPGKAMWLVAAGIGMLYVAINNYIIQMPLHLALQPHAPSWLPGVLFGLTAAIEIPLMMLSGKISRRWPPEEQLLAAAMLGAGYYIVFVMVDAWQLILLLQWLPAACIALSATAGLQLCQRLARERLGYASTLYSNAISAGMALGALIGGGIAAVWGYRASLALCSAACLLASLLFLWLRGERTRAAGALAPQMK
ncbi:sugar efflux transporter [Chromobacterium vaccinii]|uniref:sugar efflux transporter n=1 Tax=Chromobacterium vaccinii TaxID=1108595 RepID=UPI0006183380|nr:sugar efflux transporter [Chromobacterium vaccinii]